MGIASCIWLVDIIVAVIYVMMTKNHKINITKEDVDSRKVEIEFKSTISTEEDLGAKSTEEVKNTTEFDNAN